jgi:hypothetical protein
MTKTRTGGVRPLRIDGKIALEVTDCGKNDFTERFVVSVYGWKRRGYVTGQGATVDEAVADWRRNTGNSETAEITLIQEGSQQ